MHADPIVSDPCDIKETPQVGRYWSHGADPNHGKLTPTHPSLFQGDAKRIEHESVLTQISESAGFRGNSRVSEYNTWLGNQKSEQLQEIHNRFDKLKSRRVSGADETEDRSRVDEIRTSAMNNGEVAWAQGPGSYNLSERERTWSWYRTRAPPAC